MCIFIETIKYYILFIIIRECFTLIPDQSEMNFFLQLCVQKFIKMFSLEFIYLFIIIRDLI